MKKKIILVFLALVCAVCCVFGLAACGGDTNSPANPDNPNNPSGGQDTPGVEIPSVNIGATVTVEPYVITDTTNEWTVKYLYINPYGDINELDKDDLAFVAALPGVYTIRYYVYDRKFKEIKMIDRQVEAK